MMLSLIKYEWLRRWKFFLAGIVTFLAANFSIMSSLKNEIRPLVVVGTVLVLLCFALSFALFIDHIGRLYRTLYSDEGYLELALPVPGYRFVGANLLAVALECTGVSVIIGLTLYWDLLYVLRSQLDQVHFSLSFDEAWRVTQVLLMLLLIYLTFLATAYLAMTLSKTIFASFKHGKLVAFLCFLFLSWLIEKINVAAPLFREAPTLSITPFTSVDWLVNLAVLASLYLSTSYLLERKTNL